MATLVSLKDEIGSSQEQPNQRQVGAELSSCCKPRNPPSPPCCCSALLVGAASASFCPEMSCHCPPCLSDLSTPKPFLCGLFPFGILPNASLWSKVAKVHDADSRTPGDHPQHVFVSCATKTQDLWIHAGQLGQTTPGFMLQTRTPSHFLVVVML